MEIKEYMQEHGLILSDLARRAGISRQLLFWHIKYPDKPWTPDKATAIEAATQGKVFIRSLIIHRG